MAVILLIPFIYLWYYDFDLFERERQQQQRTLRRQDKKLKELLSTVEDERKQADQFKQLVCVVFGLFVLVKCGGRGVCFPLFSHLCPKHLFSLLISFVGRQKCCQSS